MTPTTHAFLNGCFTGVCLAIACFLASAWVRARKRKPEEPRPTLLPPCENCGYAHAGNQECFISIRSTPKKEPSAFERYVAASQNRSAFPLGVVRPCPCCGAMDHLLEVHDRVCPAGCPVCHRMATRSSAHP